jgi:hypothetical protein
LVVIALNWASARSIEPVGRRGGTAIDTSAVRTVRV